METKLDLILDDEEFTTTLASKFKWLTTNEFGTPAEEPNPGQIARYGAVLSALGAELTAKAKEMVEDRIEGGEGEDARMVDHGVLFEWRPPTAAVRVNTREIWQRLPREEWPHLYLESETRGHVHITIANGGKVIDELILALLWIGVGGCLGAVAALLAWGWVYLRRWEKLATVALCALAVVMSLAGAKVLANI